jgi:rhamnosyltransferase
MRIAVLMSTYNGEKYLVEQIESILNQKGDFDVDLFVRDDGSTDNTRNLLDKYQKEGKLTWYTGDNLGPALSFIDLIKKCEKYDLYSFADQDDYWKDNKLARAKDFLSDAQKTDIYFANAQLVDQDLNDLGRCVYKCTPKTDFRTLTCAGGILGCTMVFTNRLAEYIKEKPLPSEIVMHDFYICEVCLALGGEMIYDNEAVMKYRQHSNNVVGVSTGLVNKAKSRIKDITKEPKVSIANQANQIFEMYGGSISEENRKWLKDISHYRESLKSRLKLANSRNIRFINLNTAVKQRMAILFGNR